MSAHARGIDACALCSANRVRKDTHQGYVHCEAASASTMPRCRCLCETCLKRRSRRWSYDVSGRYAATYAHSTSLTALCALLPTLPAHVVSAPSATRSSPSRLLRVPAWPLPSRLPYRRRALALSRRSFSPTLTGSLRLCGLLVHEPGGVLHVSPTNVADPLRQGV